MKEVTLMHGDCLERMREIEPGSVDLVLTDPPYGTMAGAALDGWDGEKTAWDVCIDHDAMLDECNRVMRTNGAMCLFSQEPYTGKLTTEQHGNLPFSYRYVWVKDHFANSLIAKKAPVNFTEDVCVFFKKYDLLNQHPLRKYSQQVIEFIGLGLKEINAVLGHRRAEHFFYVDSTQFGLCTEATYSELVGVFGFGGEPWFIPYAELKQINERYTRTFNLQPGKKYKSNVLEYRKDYGGHHPTQKPVALLEDLIKTYTNEGDTVLDFTMGSGSTGVACVNTNRNFIGIELDEGYFDIAKQRIDNAKRLL